MLIREKRKVRKEVETVTDVKCDSCGESMIFDGDFIRGVEMPLSFGYGSKRDTERYCLHLCDTCFDQMMIFMRIDITKIKHEEGGF